VGTCEGELGAEGGSDTAVEDEYIYVHFALLLILLLLSDRCIVASIKKEDRASHLCLCTVANSNSVPAESRYKHAAVVGEGSE
jgi:hypothetical protein